MNKVKYLHDLLSWTMLSTAHDYRKRISQIAEMNSLSVSPVKALEFLYLGTNRKYSVTSSAELTKYR